MRPLLLLTLVTCAFSAEPPRWIFGAGTIGGLPAESGAEIPLPTTLVAGPGGARIELGEAPAGELLLAGGATAVLSEDGDTLVVNAEGSLAVQRTSEAGHLSLRTRTAEAEVAPGLVLADQGDGPGLLVAVRGDHRARPTAPGLPRNGWKPLAAGQAAITEAKALRLLPCPRRPQWSAKISLLDQVQGRAVVPLEGIAGLAEEDRDDLALDLCRQAAKADPLAALRHLRFLGATNRPLALVAVQIVVAAQPDRAADALGALVDGGIPADRAAAATTYGAPAQAVAIASAALQRQPNARASILRLVCAAAPDQAAAVEAAFSPPAP